jgi:hypothetical protein
VSKSAQTGERQITLTVGTQHVRKPLDYRFSERLKGAVDLGIRPLRTAMRLGFSHHLPPDQLFEPPGGIGELIRCMDKVNALTTEITGRHAGQWDAAQLGMEQVKRMRGPHPILWLQGLPLADENKVKRAVAEWADGDSVAAHYGFGIQLFCTDDVGSRKPKSVLAADNRKWLSEKYGIEFVTLKQLAARVAIQ